MNVYLNYHLSSTGEKAHLAKFGRMPEKHTYGATYYTERVSAQDFAEFSPDNRALITRCGGFTNGGDFAARLPDIVTPGKLSASVEANSDMPKATSTEPTLDAAPMTPAAGIEIAREIEAANVAALATQDETLRAYFAAYIPAQAAKYRSAAAKFDELYNWSQPTPAKEKEAERLGIDLAAALADARAEYEASRAIVAERRAKAEAASEAAAAAAKAKQEAEREAWHAEKATWAAAHGSDRLRRAVERGHDCTALYVRERAAVEAPGYTVDIYDAARWKSAACPTTAALDEAERMDKIDLGDTAEIVWLTDAPQDTKDADEDYEPDYFQPGLAIVISNYLGRYDLIRQM